MQINPQSPRGIELHVIVNVVGVKGPVHGKLAVLADADVG